MVHLLNSLPYPIFVCLIFLSIFAMVLGTIKHRTTMNISSIIAVLLFSLTGLLLFLTRTLDFFFAKDVAMCAETVSFIPAIISIILLSISVYKDNLRYDLKAKKIFWITLASFVAFIVIIIAGIALTR